MNAVYTAADDKKVTALVGLDISAASDTLEYETLINRLESQFGVDGAASSWLRSYLSGRKQFVRLGDYSSTMTSASVECCRDPCSGCSCSRSTCSRSAS